MQRHATRDRLVLPVAAVVSLGLVSVPHTTVSAASVPKLTEFAAVRLQAEVTSLVSGVSSTVASEQRVANPTPAAAAPAASTAGSTFTYNPAYTWLDNLVASLPDKIRYAILPPLYVIASALGLVIGIVQLAITPIVRLFNPTSNFPFPSAAVAAPTAKTRPDLPATASSPSGNLADPVTDGAAPPAVDAKASARIPDAVAGAVAAARSRIRARVAGAVPELLPAPSPAVAATAQPVVAEPAPPAAPAAAVEATATDVDPAPVTAAGTDQSTPEHSPRTIGNRAARATPDSAPAKQRARRSAR